MKPVIIIAIAFVLLIPIPIFAQEIEFFENKEFGEQLLITAIGVGAGVLLGGYTTLRIQKKMNDDAKADTIKNILQAIKGELEDANKGIEKFKKNPARWNKSWKFDGEKPWILRPAYDSTVNSGNFTLLEKSLQKEIPSAYLSIDAINFYSDRIRKFVYEPLGARGSANIIADELCEKLEENINKLDKKLKKLSPKF